jgi:hypothetical protein
MSSSRRLKGVYRITTSGDEDKNYSIDFQPAGRRKMKGTITGTTTVVSVMIEPRERPAGLRLEIGPWILFGDWIDDAHRLLSVSTNQKKCPWTGEWERLAEEKRSAWSVPLQWMRQHHTSGTRREKLKALNEFATMLRDMAPDRAFDPRTMWDPEEEERKAALAAELAEKEADAAAAAKGDKKGKKKKKDKKGKKGGKKGSSRKAEILAKNTKRMDQAIVEKDMTKLAAAERSGREAVAKLVLSTSAGQLSQIRSLLASSVDDRSAIDILDCLWETESFLRQLEVGEREKFIKSNRKTLERARELREDMKKLAKFCRLEGKKPSSLIAFQLTQMYDRLPPLSLVHRGKWQLDEWQKRVLTYIDEGRSVVVSAPTSSGKTVLSTYLATKTDVSRSKWKKTSSGKWRSEQPRDESGKPKKIQQGILFVTPTEPLAVQVAAMFSKLKSPTTHAPVFKGVGLAVPSRIFPPDRFSEKEVDIVVGTATALETILTSKRTLGFKFNYAVFDEVHNLNGEEGDALERIIRLIDCPFLALSATIKNATQLQSWVQTAIPSRPVELEVVRFRFINLQRHVWNGNELQMLHPCAALTRQQILTEGFDAGDLAFTARDVYALYKAMKRHYPKEKVKDIKPEKVVFPKQDNQRVTMQHVTDYEKILKDRLTELAADDAFPAETEALLKEFRDVVDKLEASNKAYGIVNDSVDASAAGGESKNSATFVQKDASKVQLPIHDICTDLRDKKMTPAVVFQMDAARCRKMFVELVEKFEADEDEEFPALAKQREQLWKTYRINYAKWEREAEDARKNDDVPPPEPSPPQFDAGDPEPKHTMFNPGKHMNGREVRDILDKMKQLAKKTKGRLKIDAEHVLVRGLRRGIGIYNEELPGVYLQVVQKFAQKGRLGAVFSDESLAYGVNMPFRTSAFVGDPGHEILDPLVAQQAAGRAGRRGMDRQGHLVWVGMSWPRIQGLIRGLLPNIRGKDPRYPAIALQSEVSTFASAPVSEEKLKSVCDCTLADFVDGIDSGHYVDKSRDWMMKMNLSILTTRSDGETLPSWRREMIWNMRSFTPESLVMEYILDDLEELIRRKDSSTKASDQRHCDQLFAVLSAIISRREMQPDQFNNTPLSEFGHQLSPHWDAWMAKIKESQTRLTPAGDTAVDELICDHMRLPVDLSATLDSTHFRIFASNGSYLGELPAVERYLERQRFFRVGECIRLMYNTLRLSGEHDELNYLMRICFLRMRYILFESFSEQFAGATSSSSLMAEAQGKTEDGDGKAASAVANEEEKGGDTKTDAPAAPEAAPAAAVGAAPEAAPVEDEKAALEQAYGKKKKKKKKKKAFVPDA